MGHRPGVGDLFIDVDARSGGLDSLAALLWDGNIDESIYPRVLTGANGIHMLGGKPQHLRIAKKHPDFPGIEFLTFGTQIVCAGSIHPLTRKPYRFAKGFPQIGRVLPQWPQQLLDLIARPKCEEAAQGGVGGEYTIEQLRRALTQLDPTEFRNHEDWLRLMMACHSATKGSGSSEFVAWSISDQNYADHADEVLHRWDLLDANRSDGVTFRTLNQILVRHGAGQFAVQGDPAADFDGDPIEPESLTIGHEESATPATANIVPKLYDFKDPANIAPREWVYKPYYLRKFIGLTASTGGVGKSRLAMAEAVAMASGQNLLGIEPLKPLRVWYWNGEDPEDEIDRGFAAIIKYYGLKREDMDGRLFRDSGRLVPIKIARTKNGMT